MRIALENVFWKLFMSVSHDQVKVLLQSQQSFKLISSLVIIISYNGVNDQHIKVHLLITKIIKKVHNYTHTSQKGSDPFLDVQLKQLIVASPEIEIGLISNYDLD